MVSRIEAYDSPTPIGPEQARTLQVSAIQSLRGLMNRLEIFDVINEDVESGKGQKILRQTAIYGQGKDLNRPRVITSENTVVKPPLLPDDTLELRHVRTFDAYGRLTVEEFSLASSLLPASERLTIAVSSPSQPEEIGQMINALDRVSDVAGIDLVAR